MKKTKIIYWSVTGLFSAFMISTAIPNIILNQDSKDLIGTLLGFPDYFIQMIGIAKVLGSIAILIPGFPRIKEWAYAGLFFDLAGATWGSIAVQGFQVPHLVMGLFFGFLFLSYFYYHKLAEETGTPAVR
jgi:DoxX-like family